MANLKIPIHIDGLSLIETALTDVRGSERDKERSEEFNNGFDYALDKVVLAINALKEANKGN